MVRDIVRKDRKEAAENIRRAAENFPLVERATDRFSKDESFKMEYYLSNHSHTVELDLFIRENPPYPKIEPPETLITCITNCPWYYDENGIWYGTIFGCGLPSEHTWWPATYDGFKVNIGGFQLGGKDNGIIVPLDGYYKIRMYAPIAGVSNWGPASYYSAIRSNGVTLAEKSYYQPNGLQWAPSPTDITTVAYLTAGANVGAWMMHDNFYGFTAYEFCNWWGGNSLFVELVGT